MLKRQAVSPPTSHEDLFIQRYRWLMDSALRLTNRDHEQAEDLVHDV
jgi:DNA-directed RNA polymerase specialized sigma24 family protein